MTVTWAGEARRGAVGGEFGVATERRGRHDGAASSWLQTGQWRPTRLSLVSPNIQSKRLVHFFSGQLGLVFRFLKSLFFQKTAVDRFFFSRTQNREL